MSEWAMPVFAGLAAAVAFWIGGVVQRWRFVYFIRQAERDMVSLLKQFNDYRRDTRGSGDVVGALEFLVREDASSVVVFCENADADSNDKARAIGLINSKTDYMEQRFYGPTLAAALGRAVDFMRVS